MASLDWGYVSIVLSRPWNEIRGMEIDDSFLADEAAKKACEFIHLYSHETGKAPEVHLVKERFPSFEHDSSVEPAWLARELRQRRTFSILQGGLARAAADLQHGSMNDVLETLDRVQNDVRAVQIGASAIDLRRLGPSLREFYNDIKMGRMGIELPWKSINAMTRGLWPETLTFFVARPSVGKCVRGDTPILDPSDGIYRPIHEVVQQGRMVLSRDASGQIVSTLPDAFLQTGRKRCIRITLASGRVLSGTPEHPVMTADGWKRLDLLAVDDHVETVRTTPEPMFTENPFDEEVVLLAALLADGGYTSGQVSFTNQDTEILSLVSNACDRYQIELRKTKGMKPWEWKVCWKKDLGHWSGLGTNPARVLLDKYECGHKLAKEKTIPSRVFSFSNEKLALFLGVFWGCDGYVDKHDTGVTLASEEMVRQIQRLLLRFGVLSSVSYKPAKCQGKVFDSWRLRVYSSTLEQFRKHIDPLVSRKKRIPEGQPCVHPNVDNIPVTPTMKQRLREIVGTIPPRERAALWNRMSKLLGMKARISVDKLYRRPTITRRVFQAFIDVFKANEFTPLFYGHWDKVVTIEDDGIQDVYDLTVRDTHSFVANDVIVHNTFLAIIVARHAHLCGKRVLIISPEMNAIEVGERFFAIDASVSYSDVISGSLSQLPGQDGRSAEERYFEALDSRAGELDGPYILDDEDKLTASSLEAAIAKIGPDLVAIDAAYLLRIGRGSRYDRIIEVVEWMRHVSKVFHVPVLATSQLNKESEKKGQGGMQGVAMTDTISWDAHNLFALKQTTEMRDDGKLSIIPIKVRRMAKLWGKAEIDVMWDLERMRFDEIDATDGKEFKDEGFEDTAF